MCYVYTANKMIYMKHHFTTSCGIRESLDSMYGRCRRTIYAILKQSLYNFTTNMLKALSAQGSSLSAFVISKVHIKWPKATS